MLRLSIIALLLVSAVGTNAQIIQTARFERDIKFVEENFLVIPTGERGVLLLRESVERDENRNGNAWQLISLNNELSQIWDTLIVVEHKFEFLGFDYSDGFLYLLFEEEYVRKKKVFEILKINKQNGEVVKYDIETELEIAPIHLIINENQMVLGGQINNRLTFVVFNYQENNVMVVPGFFNNKSVILDFNYNPVHKVYTLLLSEKNAANRNELTIRSFNNEGKVFIDQKVLFDEESRALNGKIKIADDMRVYYCGSYGKYNSYYSQGMFFGYLEGGKEPKITFYNLGEFEHIFDYMTTKRANRIKDKIDRGLKSGRSYKFKTQLWVQYFYQFDDQFVLLSDIYRPEDDRSNNRDPYSGNYSSNNDDNTNQKFVHYTSGITNADDKDKIQYYESILMRFNKEGKLISDVSLPTPKAETLALEKLSTSHVGASGVSLIYKDENKIRYRLFDTEATIKQDSSQNINIFKEGDTITRITDNQGKIQKWYDNHFFVWGYHRIEDSYGEKRTVFFMNKISIVE